MKQFKKSMDFKYIEIFAINIRNVQKCASAKARFFFFAFSLTHPQIGSLLDFSKIFNI